MASTKVSRKAAQKKPPDGKAGSRSGKQDPTGKTAAKKTAGKTAPRATAPSKAAASKSTGSKASSSKASTSKTTASKATAGKTTAGKSAAARKSTAEKAAPHRKATAASAGADRKNAGTSSAKSNGGAARAPAKSKTQSRESAEARSSRKKARSEPKHMSDGAPPSPKRRPKWHMRLYVAGDSPRSRLALSNLQRLCEDRLKDDYEIEVIDLTQAPHLAKADQILAVPTLVRSIPEPMKRIIGDLSNADRALVALDLDVISAKSP